MHDLSTTFPTGTCCVSSINIKLVPFLCALLMDRDPQPAGRTVQMLGAAVGVSYPAAAGPAGVLPPQSRDWAGILTQLGQAGREVLLQDPQLQGTPTVQVSSPACEYSLQSLCTERFLCKAAPSLNVAPALLSLMSNMNDFSVLKHSAGLRPKVPKQISFTEKITVCCYLIGRAVWTTVFKVSSSVLLLLQKKGK